ncbi:MAG: hypothetical protein ACETVR_02945 [Candidatus Bathyarchaeia archaeon]
MDEEPRARSRVYWERCIPFPDEDINKYVGKVVDASKLGEIGGLIKEKYGTRSYSIEFYEIEAELIQKDNKLIGHISKVLITNILDQRKTGPRTPERGWEIEEGGKFRFTCFFKRTLAWNRLTAEEKEKEAARLRELCEKYWVKVLFEGPTYDLPKHVIYMFESEKFQNFSKFLSELQPLGTPEAHKYIDYTLTIVTPYP